jgi:hypothetical protein
LALVFGQGFLATIPPPRVWPGIELLRYPAPTSAFLGCEVRTKRINRFAQTNEHGRSLFERFPFAAEGIVLGSFQFSLGKMIHHPRPLSLLLIKADSRSPH